MTTSRVTLLLASTALVGILAAPSGSAAQSAEVGTLQVSATVPDACLVSTGGSLQFGEYTPGGAQLPGNTSFEIECTVATDLSIELDGGQHSQGTARGMKNGTDDILRYDLYTEAFQPWGDNDTYPVGPQSVTLAQGSNTITVNGIIEEGQTVRGGTYEDTVQISIKF